VRVESSVSSVTWVPSDAVTGVARLQFVVGLAGNDDPPPDRIESAEALLAQNRVRQINELSAWVEFDDADTPVTWDYSTEATYLHDEAFPTLRSDPVVEKSGVRFVQTTGGPLGVAVPRRVLGRPFFRVDAPVAWTTLALTLKSDGSAHGELVGASPFPRHWVYDAEGALQATSAETDYRRWLEGAHSGHTPWGGEDSPEFVAKAESSFERRLSRRIMEGQPRVVTVQAGTMLTEQGARDDTIYLVLDGLLDVDVGGQTVAEVGPGAIIGERASLEGRRSATVRARTDARVVPLTSDSLTAEERSQLAAMHNRDETGSPT
jgi:hypothetical protein